MDKVIVFLAESVMPTLVIILFLSRVALFFYLHRKNADMPGLFSSSILPFEVIIPIKKSENMEPGERQMVSLANLALYLFIISIIFGGLLAWYGRKHELIFMSSGLLLNH